MSTARESVPTVSRLDPDADALVRQLTLSPSPPISSLSVAEARAGFVPPAWTGQPRAVAATRDLVIPGPDGPLPARLYVPHGSGPLPVLVFFHGGGFVVGALGEFEPFCTAVAAGAGCLVVSVGYRLAPEHSCPAATDDAEAAVRWVGARAAELGGDPHRLAIAGDSAGGNLAAVTALMARDEGAPRLALQILISPWVDLSSTDSDSFRRFGGGPWLSTASIRWSLGHYLASPEQARLPRVSPLLAPDLSGLAPAVVINAEADVLHDQVKAYARRLEAAGTPVDYRPYPGSLHDFATLPGLFRQASVAIDDICSALRQAFERPGA